MRILKIAFLSLFCLSIFSCNDLKSPSDLENCCSSADPLVELGSSGEYILMPNVFTPNNDGQNDILLPFIFADIDSLSVTVMAGTSTVHTSSDTLLTNIEFWDGKNGSSLVKEGSYDWELYIRTKTGEEETIKRSFCVFIDCESAADFPAFCYFPDQLVVGGNFIDTEDGICN